MTTAIEALVTTISGTGFVGLDTVTDVKLSGGRKNILQGRVKKVMKGATVMMFTNKNSNGYENMVNRRLEAEGKVVEFKVHPRVWGKRVEGKPIVEHNGEKYLEAVFIKPGAVHYELDGKPVDPSTLEGFQSAKVYEEQQGGVENKVALRVFKFSSITGMRIAGVDVKVK